MRVVYITQRSHTEELPGRLRKKRASWMNYSSKGSNPELQGVPRGM